MIDGRLAGWAALVLILSALNFAGNLTSDGSSSSDTLYTWSAAASGLVQVVILLGVLLAISRGLDRRRAFALRRPTSWGTALKVALGVLVAVFILGAILDPFLNPGREQGLLPSHWRPDRVPAFAVNALVVVLLAPVVEELMFRGLGFTLLRRFGRLAAILLVGLAFGLVHGLVDALPVLVAFGCGLAYIRSRTQSVFPTIAVHSCFNALVLALALST